jgi:hypothetical protein
LSARDIHEIEFAPAHFALCEEKQNAASVQYDALPRLIQQALTGTMYYCCKLKVRLCVQNPYPQIAGRRLRVVTYRKP